MRSLAGQIENFTNQLEKLLVENNGNIRIELDELTRALELILQHVRAYQNGPVEIAEDYYWEIPQAQLYDPTKDPSSFTIGQLSEDWTRIEQLLKGEAPPIGYALVWLGSILRAVGQKNVP
jgi:hypothetical protein